MSPIGMIKPSSQSPSNLTTVFVAVQHKLGFDCGKSDAEGHRQIAFGWSSTLTLLDLMLSNCE
ncbi:hypothetical protein [Mesorhizobium sp.]|uniref:hypothetical protein n=1 Tax=Mesorhizobium sp. TaxID=1871066 RepID=UPI0025C70C1B|nr:hypothetical protein [Mesorhizobium sp.]